MSCMKKLYFFIILCLLSGLTSCVDVVERYTFKASGECNVAYDFDMSQAVSVLMNLLSDSVAASPQFAIKKDTTMNLYNALPDSTQAKLNIEETRMARSSKLAVLMNLKVGKMKVSVSHDAQSASDMEYYLQRISTLANDGAPAAQALKKGTLNAFNIQQLIAGQNCYAYQVTPHKFYRIVDKAKFNRFLQKTQATFAMAKAMLIETPYKVVLNFARPVKKINNRKAVLSTDRRQVILKTNMDEIIKNPSIMDLRIDF